MITVLQYLVIAAAIGLVVFLLAALIFGRGEQLAPLPARTSPAELPERVVSGGDIRALRYPAAVRGYRMSDVDWSLEKIADEVDRLRREVLRLGGDPDLVSEADLDLLPHEDATSDGSAGAVPGGSAGRPPSVRRESAVDADHVRYADSPGPVPSTAVAVIDAAPPGRSAAAPDGSGPTDSDLGDTAHFGDTPVIDEPGTPASVPNARTVHHPEHRAAHEPPAARQGEHGDTDRG